MADINITVHANVEGLSELEEALTAGSVRAAKKFLRGVEQRVARKLKLHISEEAPYETGELSEDIHAQTRITEDALTVRIGPSKRTFWGYIQEFGAPEANVPAQHWMENTAVRYQDETLRNYMDEVTKALQEMKK